MSTILVTCGDVNGIGLRCLAGALAAEPELAQSITLVIDRAVLDHAQSLYGFVLQANIHTVYSPCAVTPGVPSAEASRLAILSLETAFTLAREHADVGVVTLPISKHALQSVGWPFDGQTEMAGAYSTGSPLMVMCSGTDRIALCTVHTPLSQVASLITVDRIVDVITTFHKHLTTDVALHNPRIAVLGLNPHASEQGNIGTEDVTVVSEAIRRASQQGMLVEGPFPADGFFGFGSYAEYDGIVAMYHDQGLIPIKMLSHGAGVNVTAGLDLVRTSPDHGTAYALAASGEVDFTSTLQAIRLCKQIVDNRKVSD